MGGPVVAGPVVAVLLLEVRNNSLHKEIMVAWAAMVGMGRATALPARMVALAAMVQTAAGGEVGLVPLLLMDGCPPQVAAEREAMVLNGMQRTVQVVVGEGEGPTIAGTNTAYLVARAAQEVFMAAQVVVGGEVVTTVRQALDAKASSL